MCDGESAAYLRTLCIQEGGDLRPCLPADMCKLVKALAQYEGNSPVLEQRTIDRVLGLYYTRGVAGSRSYETSDPTIEQLAAELSPESPAPGALPEPLTPGPVSTF